MKLLRNKKITTVLIFLGIGAAYLALRLWNITGFPIFTDEAIYIRWSQIANQDANWRFISLTDGKQPMFVWVAMVLMHFISDPLLAGRMVSVIAGFASVVGLYLAGREIFKNHWVGVFSAALYVIYPFALVYDRMALYDSLVGAFAVWSLYFSILLVRTLRLDVALVMGMIVGGGMLTKTNAFFNLLPLTILIFDISNKKRLSRFLKFIGLYGVMISLAFMFYSILRLSPFFHIITEKNALFVYPVNEWLEHPFTFFSSNFFGLWDWFWTYMTLPWIGLALFSLVSDRKFFREKILLIVCFLIPFIYLSFFGKNIYPRFIFFMTLSLLPLVAYGFVRLSEVVKNKYIFYVVVALLTVYPVWKDYYVLTDFGNAPIPRSDIIQYYSDWPSGIGVKEAVSFFEKEAKKGKIYIGTEGTFGLMPYALEIYLVDNPNVIIKGFYPINPDMPKEIIDARTKYPTYWVSYQPCSICRKPGTGPTMWPLKTILQFEKKGNAFFTVSQVTP